ncbi:hypothetical protein [Nocardia sp. IFM 10818]
MTATTRDTLPDLITQYRSVAAAAIANFHTPRGGRGKQGKRRTDAALRRAAKYSQQLRDLESRILALGGTIPDLDPTPEPTPAKPVVTQAPPLHTMTLDALRAEDAELESARRAVGSPSLTPRHRQIKTELGHRAAQRSREAVAARRSDAGKRGALTRARRKAAGLPPKRQRFALDNAPAGGWTDEDCVG